MKLLYHHIFRNLDGYLECNIQTYDKVKRIQFVNLNYCDNKNWLYVRTTDGKTYEILVKKDDEYEILGD